jgi:hypothetical protein
VVALFTILSARIAREPVLRRPLFALCIRSGQLLLLLLVPVLPLPPLLLLAVLDALPLPPLLLLLLLFLLLQQQLVLRIRKRVE